MSVCRNSSHSFYIESTIFSEFNNVFLISCDDDLESVCQHLLDKNTILEDTVNVKEIIGQYLIREKNSSHSKSNMEIDEVHCLAL